MLLFSAIVSSSSGVAVPVASNGGQLLEESDHGGRTEQIEFPSQPLRSDPEGVRNPSRDVDKAAGGAEPLVFVEIHEVLALEDEECLRCVSVPVHGRAEPGRLLLGHQQCERI
jgi:hypothetical protein